MVTWTLVFHIIGLVFWLGSLLVVTRALAIHTEETAAEARAALSRLESKLLKGFTHAGAAIMVITGFILIAHDPSYLREHWMHAKLFLVVVLVALDLRVTFRARQLQDGAAAVTRGECMALHGAVALIFFMILILVLVKPFGTQKHHAQLWGSPGSPAPVALHRRVAA